MFQIPEGRAFHPIPEVDVETSESMGDCRAYRSVMVAYGREGTRCMLYSVISVL